MQRRGRPALKHSMWQLECACLSPSNNDSFASRVAKFSHCLHSLAQIAELRPAVASEMLGHEIRVCLALSCSPLGHNLLLPRDIDVSMPRRRAHATSCSSPLATLHSCEATSCTSPRDEHASPAGFPGSVNTGGALAANKFARAVRRPPNPHCWTRASSHAQAGRRQPPFQRCLLCRNGLSHGRWDARRRGSRGQRRVTYQRTRLINSWPALAIAHSPSRVMFVKFRNLE